jgi:hypothetical protein
MLQLTNPDNPRRRVCGALLVLVAVCSLAISLATRYSSPVNPSSTKVSSVQKQVLSEPGRQRLTKSVANWLPLVVCYTMLQAPTAYPPVAPEGPPIVASFLGDSLYNRPPPPSFQS